MTTPEPAPAYLDPLHNELDRLRTENETLRARLLSAEAAAGDEEFQHDETFNILNGRLEQAEARINDLLTQLDEQRAFNKQRSDALNRTGASNDTLRATLARVRSLADSAGSGFVTFGGGRSGGIVSAEILRMILDDQETL